MSNFFRTIALRISSNHLRCAVKGRERAVEHLLSFSNCAIDSIDDNHYTPLILASLNGRLKVVELLIKNGAKIDSKNLQGHSSLQVKYTTNCCFELCNITLNIFSMRALKVGRIS